METLDILKIAARALDSKKAIDLQAIKIGDLTIITDFFLLATATSSTHVRALADEVEEMLSRAGVEPNHIEGKATGWILLDYGSVVVHVFDRKSREFYQLERLWNDGESYDLSGMLADGAPSSGGDNQ
ncbi:MAG: ribosome silencing factor [Clostridiales bacterium]|nr:ribosome silencing factor [Clostridiales bacterium]